MNICFFFFRGVPPFLHNPLSGVGHQTFSGFVLQETIQYPMEKIGVSCKSLTANFSVNVTSFPMGIEAVVGLNLPTEMVGS